MRRSLHLLIAVFVIAAGLLVSTTESSAAPPEPQPVTLPCATNVSAQLLGNGLPAAAEGQALVLVRIVLGPGGSFGAHTHPGTLVGSIESGTLGLTLLEEGEMTIMRSGEAGTPAVEEPLTPGQEVELGPGDWFVETSMAHSARAIGEEPVMVLLSGLIEAGQPLAQCVEGTPTP
jgi:quercetin dioxygenase-like cupin family protein